MDLYPYKEIMANVPTRGLSYLYPDLLRRPLNLLNPFHTRCISNHNAMLMVLVACAGHHARLCTEGTTAHAPDT